MKIIKIVFCVFFPPAAVFMQVDATKHFWINVLLTILCWFPGVIHALWVVLSGKTK